QSGRADLALSAQPLARQLGVYQPGGHHGCLRDVLEPVRHQPRPDPLALRSRLGSSFARFIGGTDYVAEIEPTLASRNLRRSVLFADSRNSALIVPADAASQTGRSGSTKIHVQ